jgi:hypothetical protein
VSGALTVKANGVLTFLAIGLLTTMNMLSLATDLSINSVRVAFVHQSIVDAMTFRDVSNNVVPSLT